MLCEKLAWPLCKDDIQISKMFNVIVIHQKLLVLVSKGSEMGYCYHLLGSDVTSEKRIQVGLLFHHFLGAAVTE